MNLSNYIPIDLVNGEGVRATVFVSGCSHACRGCYNQKTWNKDFGYEYTKEIEDGIITDLNDPSIKRHGLSLSGGDPLFSNNLETIYNLVKRVRAECKGKNIWLWSGYTLDELKKDNSEDGELRLKIINLVDVFIDGKFIEDEKDIDLKWRGSSNQKINYISI